MITPMPTSGLPPALAQPSTIGELLVHYGTECPAITTRNNIALLRASIVAVLNSALQNPTYTNEQLIDYRNTLDRIILIDLATGYHLPKSFIEDAQRVFTIVCNDICLGASYIEHKRGSKAVTTYLQTDGVQTCVKVGKKLREGARKKRNECVIKKQLLPVCILEDGRNEAAALAAVSVNRTTKKFENLRMPYLHSYAVLLNFTNMLDELYT
jgi:hypothetical protein